MHNSYMYCYTWCNFLYKCLQLCIRYSPAVWSTQGIVKGNCSSGVCCQSNHLTNFAVLVNIGGVRHVRMGNLAQDKFASPSLPTAWVLSVHHRLFTVEYTVLWYQLEDG